MGDYCNFDIYRVIQLTLAVVGLVCSTCSMGVYTILVILYALIIVYEIVLLICLLTNKVTLGGRTQSVVDIVLGVLLLAYTIYVITAGSKDVWLVVALIVGFVLPSFLFISAYLRF